jgi:hypothetical protein
MVRATLAPSGSEDDKIKEQAMTDEKPYRHVDRIAELEDALRRVVRDVNDYEEANKLSPNPGRSECWDSVAHAKAVLQKSVNT